MIIDKEYKVFLRCNGMISTNSDGASRGNPGQGAIAVIVRKDGKILTKYSQKIGDFVTNNMAEYEALIKALELASEFDKELECNLDSELVVKQLLGEYRVKNPRLLKLFLKVQKAQEKFDKIKYTHVKRWDEFQKVVDKLVNEELDSK